MVSWTYRCAILLDAISAVDELRYLFLPQANIPSPNMLLSKTLLTSVFMVLPIVTAHHSDVYARDAYPEELASLMLTVQR